MHIEFKNPFKPGAGHMPPYLAGRIEEREQFKKLLKQDVILENLILTGLRGIGKTVLLDTFKPIAMRERWLWASSNLSESASISEETLVTRILTDISLITANISIESESGMTGFVAEKNTNKKKLDLSFLNELYKNSVGLTSDKLKNILEFVWSVIKQLSNIKGMIFAFDEAQTMSDHKEQNQFPLSVMLDVFQSIQRKNIPFMLVLVGLPTLPQQLVEARTFAERMFRILTLTKLSKEESREAIDKPIKESGCPVTFDDKSIDLIIDAADGYPYFIQFICKEVYDVAFQKILSNSEHKSVPLDEIMAKLDTDFFSGRWQRATDRQRDLLTIISELKNCNDEFTIQEIVEQSNELPKPMSSSQVSQMLTLLIQNGLIFKNRYSKYSFAVPLLGEFIKRQNKPIGV